MPIPTYPTFPIARDEIPNLAAPFTADNTLPNRLDTKFTTTEVPKSPTVPQFAFQPHPLFPTSTTFTPPIANNTYEQPYYESDVGYYGGEVWQTQSSGTEASHYLDENGAGYGYYAPTEHGQPSQYDNRDRSSPPQYPEYTFNYGNGHSA